MDQIKIGNCLKELRKEKGLTQEDLALILNVSRRSVSRWETGSNLPDLDILIELSNYYEVSLIQLLDGNAITKMKENELNEVALKVADYSNEEKIKLNKRMNLLFVFGFIASLIYLILFTYQKSDNFLGGLTLGITQGTIIGGMLMTSRYALKFRRFKQKLFKKLVNSR